MNCRFTLRTHTRFIYNVYICLYTSFILLYIYIYIQRLFLFEESFALLYYTIYMYKYHFFFKSWTCEFFGVLNYSYYSLLLQGFGPLRGSNHHSLRVDCVFTIATLSYKCMCLHTHICEGVFLLHTRINIYFKSLGLGSN